MLDAKTPDGRWASSKGASMRLTLLRFANLFVAGLNTGVAFSHAQQAPQKAKLDRKSLVDVSGSCICDMGRPPRFLSLARLRPL